VNHYDNIRMAMFDESESMDVDEGA
jgi:hypothetical protein